MFILQINIRTYIYICVCVCVCVYVYLKYKHGFIKISKKLKKYPKIVGLLHVFKIRYHQKKKNLEWIRCRVTNHLPD